MNTLKSPRPLTEDEIAALRARHGSRHCAAGCIVCRLLAPAEACSGSLTAEGVLTRLERCAGTCPAALPREEDR